jgi:hypothetical protein
MRTANQYPSGGCMQDSITVLIEGDSYEVAPGSSVADLKELADCLEGDVHVRSEEREYVLPNDTVLSDHIEAGAQLAVVSATW